MLGSLIKLNFLFNKYKIYSLIPKTSQPCIFKIFVFLNFLLPWNVYLLIFKPAKNILKEDLLNLFLSESGVFFIKLGQFLSLRDEFIPKAIIERLSLLQDACPEIEFNTIKKIIEKEFNANLDDIFFKIDSKPLATASIAQVHRAKIKETKEEVVIKVVKPDVLKQIKTNLKQLKFIVFFINLAFLNRRKQLNLSQFIDEFEVMLYKETDMLMEASNASFIRDKFQAKKEFHDLIYVPKIFWEYTTNKVLCMEYIDGLKINSIKKAENKIDISLDELSKNGIKIFFTQIFTHNIFHADLHPGNVFILQDGRFCAIDFGIVGFLSKADKNFVLMLLKGFLNKDYDVVAKSFMEASMVDLRGNKKFKEIEFQNDIRKVSEYIWGVGINSISLADLLNSLIQVAKKYKIQLRASLMLLKKTLISIEYLGKAINKDLNLLPILKDFFNDFEKQNIFLQKNLTKDLVINKFNYYLEFWEQIPENINAVLIESKNNSQLNKKVLQTNKKALLLSSISVIITTFAILYLAIL